MFSVKLGSVAWCTGEDECKILKPNKESEVVGGRSPHWGEPHIPCVDGFICAMMFML